MKKIFLASVLAVVTLGCVNPQSTTPAPVTVVTPEKKYMELACTFDDCFYTTGPFDSILKERDTKKATLIKMDNNYPVYQAHKGQIVLVDTAGHLAVKLFGTTKPNDIDKDGDIEILYYF